MPVRVLAIAPYDSMAVSLIHAVEAFPNIRMKTYTGDLEEGAAIVRKVDLLEYDVILSRGGTAELIRSFTDLPVVEISISVYDVLRIIKLSENYTDSFAVVGFPAVTASAHTLCNLLRITAPIVTVYDAEGAAAALDRLHEQNIQTVICDKVTHAYARTKGFNALLITSGENSIQQALREAEIQGSSFRRMRLENQFLHRLLQGGGAQYMVFDDREELVYSFPEKAGEELVSFARRRIPAVREEEENLVYHQEGTTLYAVTANLFRFQERRYWLFRVESGSMPMHTRHPGIRSYDAVECEQLFMNSFFSVSGSLAPLKQRLISVTNSARAVMIVGEEGTGREQIARYLYLNGRSRSRPLVVVDGIQLGTKGWAYLLENHGSPLAASGMTILFQHLEDVPVQYQQELFSLMEDTNLSRRLRLIFSVSEQEGEPLPGFIRQLSVKLGPLTLHLPTLRNRQDEIPALASVYLGTLNEELGKQLSGFEPGAMEMMMRYDWPGNYSQFKNFLQEMAVLASGPYISTHDVAEQLARERRIHRHSQASGEGFTYSGQTMEEITRSIAQQALLSNRGNQSQTARQLGISRTTLWRMLSHEESKKK